MGAMEMIPHWLGGHRIEKVENHWATSTIVCVHHGGHIYLIGYMITLIIDNDNYEEVNLE